MSFGIRSFGVDFGSRLVAGTMAFSALSACGGVATEDDPSVRVEAQAFSRAHHSDGERLFQEPFEGTNGRSCATCHVLEEHTVLSPAHVSALFAEAPDDPLFNRIDADDPSAPEPSYEHLKKGLVRVVLDVPVNMDVIDLLGNVVTSAERTIEVWRAVPTSENTAITAPYQYDGRRATLQEQAQGAITAHSEGGQVADEDLDRIAEFQQTLFTSDRARFVAKQLARGVPVADIPDPEAHLRLNEQQQRGSDLYAKGCEPCHGGATKTQVVNRTVHDLTFVEVNSDGNVLFAPGQPPRPVLAPRPNDEFFNVGFAFLSYLGQVGILPMFNASVALPRYRFRFYTDGSRSQRITDLPPIPVTVSGDPFDLRPALDENGAPIVGPNFLPQVFSTDPGRAIITGDSHHFEAFDMPPLRGISNTAPYFHDNSAETLLVVVDLYSRFILPFFVPTLDFPTIHPPEFEGGPPESLTPAEKQDLIAFLNLL